MRRIMLVMGTIAALCAGAAWAAGEVARAQFCSAVVDREPLDELSGNVRLREGLYFFTELHGLAGETVVHQWRLNDVPVAEVHLDVGADRWRTWSRKTLTPELAGRWTVRVTTATGELLHEAAVTVAQ